MRLRFGLAYSDRALPLIERSVSSRRFDYSVSIDKPGSLFLGMLEKRTFDVCEMSLASYVIRRSRGLEDLVALPVFPSRGFPHHTLYALRQASEGGIDWEVRTIGVPEYQMTAGVWARMILEEELGVPLEHVRWRTGALEGGLRHERIPLPESIARTVDNDTSGRGLAQALVDGELDLLISPTVPSGQGVGRAAIKRLLPDYARREVAFYERTRVFPIMHTVVIRAELLEAEPWLGAEIYSLLRDAKELALRRIQQTDTYVTSLAWLPGAVDFHRALLGDQLWPYGVDANLDALNAFLVACHRQGLLARDVPLDELFVQGV